VSARRTRWLWAGAVAAAAVGVVLVSLRTDPVRVILDLLWVSGLVVFFVFLAVDSRRRGPDRDESTGSGDS